jgi:hypothetical protein
MIAALTGRCRARVLRVSGDLDRDSAAPARVATLELLAKELF